VDYFEKHRRHPVKMLVVWLLSLGWINLIAVGLLRRLPAGDWRRRVPVVGVRARFDAGESGNIIMSSPDQCRVARELWWMGGRMASGADQLALELAMSLSADAERFLDIGAYSGLFALAVARRNREIRCDAYEIVRENLEILTRNIGLNNLGDRVHAQLCGIGATHGEIRVPGSFGVGVLPSSVALDSECRKGESVSVRTLDELYPGFCGRMVWKLDVETFEFDVLKGGQQLLERTKPDMVCEVLMRSKKTADLQAFLATRGYRFFHITSVGLRPMNEIFPDRECLDWLFTCRPEAELARWIG